MHALSPATAPTDVLPLEGQVHLQPSGIDSRVVLGDPLPPRARGILHRTGMQTALGRPVTVLLPGPDASPEAVEALRAEARLMARLAHPNILPVHAILDDDDEGLRVLLASVPGDTWERRLSQPHIVRGSFGAEDVLAWHVDVLLQICRALCHAHAQGVLHGDLRPDTVWIGDLGEVYLADWSGAVPLERAGPLDADTLAEAAHRSSPALAYLPPERILAKAGPVDARSDVYHLGGLLYRILTGHGPHGEEPGPETLRQALFRDPEFPHSAPPSLARVCKRALSRNPEARHPSVAAFREALEAAFAQRGAWDIAAEADARFDDLQRLLRTDPVDAAALYRTYGEVRLGYARALAEAPGLATARRRMDRALELVIGHLLAEGNLSGAAAVLAHADAPPEHLVHDLAEARADRDQAVDTGDHEARAAEIGRTLDPTRDGARRTWLATVLGLVWVPAPLLDTLIDTAWRTPVLLAAFGTLSLFAIAVTRMSDADRAHSRLTRELAAWSIWGTVSIGALLAIAGLAGVPAPLQSALAAAGALLIAGTGSFSLDGRLAVPAVGYGVVTVLSLALPGSWGFGMFAANLVLAAVLVIGAQPGGQDVRR